MPQKIYNQDMFTIKNLFTNGFSIVPLALLIQLENIEYHLIDSIPVLLVHFVFALFAECIQGNIQIGPILLHNFMQPQLVRLDQITKCHHNVIGNLY